MNEMHTARFSHRRDAEMAVERLAQEYGVDRKNISVRAVGAENSAGENIAGADARSGKPTPPERHDAAVNGDILVVVAAQNPDDLQKLRDAFDEFGAETGVTS